MGNVLSSASTSVQVTSESETMNDDTSVSRDQAGSEVIDELYLDAIKDDEARAKWKEDEMTEFKKQLSIKREQRRQILARHKAEKEDLEKCLSEEKKSHLELSQTNKLLRELLVQNGIQIPETLQSDQEDYDIKSTITQMKEEFENLKSNNNKLRSQLANANTSLQNAYSDIADLNSQNIESMKQIGALKEVVSVSKTMIKLREQQLDELKDKLSEIEKSLADREASMLSTDLKQEYERQLQNIRTLRGLYEERARLSEITRQSLIRELDEQKLMYQTEVNKSKVLSDKVNELEDKVDALIETIDQKNNQISICRDESLGLRAEMAIVNKLFSEVLLGYKTKKDLDKLANRLEENHGILTQMAEIENDSEALTALPKLLLEIVNQVDEEDESKSDTKNEYTPIADQIVTPEPSSSTSNPTPEEIMQNLPKVWRVLMELLSHQNETENDPAEKVTTCYKSVETKSGPVLVPSVSQTYIRLKDLIVEKLTLIKEVNRMKQLNSHLETRLGKQERRLCLVTTELSKTWHVVGRLRRHHNQLHTHEKILKYELQQKRKLLNELKEELEYCREKWEQAREKNTQSEKDWRNLRAEFSSRKVKSDSPSFNQSAESGYSDERPSDESSESNDESEYVTEPPIRCKKKLKKSFETILDSSTELNMVAEREDPVSDMIDVADLPLDTHDECHSDNILKGEILCEETEDELCDITIDSYLEETNTDFDTSQSKTNNDEDLSSNVLNLPSIDSRTSSEIKNENHDDGQKDQAGKSTQTLFDNLSTTEETGNQNVLQNAEMNLLKIKPTGNCESSNEIAKLESNDAINQTTNGTHSSSDFSGSSYETPLPTVDFKAIIMNVRKQDDNLALKDMRLMKLESGCSEVVNSINNTLTLAENMKQKLDLLHNNGHSLNAVTKPKSNVERNESPCNVNESEASTSGEVNHEARFAARDLRLKRLEEQTKCLVNKVNNTTTKGVKIHYKLEELHSIYGSESSRAGTPSEDTEDREEENDEENIDDNI